MESSFYCGGDMVAAPQHCQVQFFACVIEQND
jgi:hypothetical protein